MSKADAPAVVVGWSARQTRPGSDSIEIPLIQRASIRVVATRCVLASVGQQRCSPDQAYQTTCGHGNEVQLLLRAVAASKPANKPAQATPLGTLPASFIGERPCDDCAGIRIILPLSDRAFFSRMTYP